MDLNKWLGKKVKIIINNGFAYIGNVIDADDNSLTLIDITNSRVSLKESSISVIKDFKDNGSRD